MSPAEKRLCCKCKYYFATTGTHSQSYCENREVMAAYNPINGGQLVPCFDERMEVVKPNERRNYPCGVDGDLFEPKEGT